MASKQRKSAIAADDFSQSILTKLVDEQQVKSTDEEYTTDVAVLFCGSKRSGKTSLVDRFINPKKDEKDVPKSTVALDYKYARRDASDGTASKILAHIYDLGGDDGNEDLVAIPVSQKSVGNLVLCVTLDLSEPHNVIPALEKWLTLLRAQATKSLEGLAKSSSNGSKQVEFVQNKCKEPWEGHADAASVVPFPVPLVIFGAKWDVLTTDTDPEKRKNLCRALRHFAHKNGASLVCSSLKDKDSMNAVRGILRQLIFGAAAKTGLPDQTDPSKPLCVVAGKDDFESIGKPQGAQSGDAAWRDLIGVYFPDPQPRQGKDKDKTESQKLDEKMQEMQERMVDGMVSQRTMELELYRKQAERNQRLASEGVDASKMAGVAA